MESFVKIQLNKYRTFIIYSIIGVSGIILDFLLFTLLVKVFEVDKYLANFISVSAGITNNFIWNTFINFKTKDNLTKRYISFYLIGSVGTLVGYFILFIFTDTFKFDEVIVKGLSTPVIVITQYFLNKKVSFKQYDKTIA